MAGRKRKSDPLNPYEWQVQRAIVETIRTRLPAAVVAAVPNETRGGDYRALHEQQVKVSQGVLPGFPDLILLYNGHTVCIEVKRKKGGVVSAKQKAVHRQLEMNGFEVHVMRGSDGIDPLIDDLLSRPMGSAWCLNGADINDIHSLNC